MARAVAAMTERLATDVSTAYDNGGADAAHALLHDPGIRTLREATDRYRNGGTLRDDEAGTVLLLLRYLLVRDHALRHAEPADLPLWTDLTRRAPDDLVPAPATLLAYTALRKGTGALANIALDCALAGDPDYNLGHLLHAATRIGLPPNLLHERLAEAFDTQPE
jgi:hypothetical protein